MASEADHVERTAPRFTELYAIGRGCVLGNLAHVGAIIIHNVIGCCLSRAKHPVAAKEPRR